MSNSGTPPPSSPGPHGPHGPHGPPAQRYPNVGTMPSSDPSVGRASQAIGKRRVLSAAEVYTRAVAADRLREPQVQIGYRLYWMTESSLGSQDVYAGPNGYSIVGRHSSCDVVLEDERVISLRHVLVRVTALDDGFPVLRVLDLQSTSGFELSDGSTQRSVAATGPVVFRIGGYSFVALPSTGKFPDALPVPLVEKGEAGGHRVVPRRIDPRALGAAAAAAVAAVGDPAAARAPHLRLVPPPGAPPSEDPPRSRITSMPASVDFSQRRSSVPSFTGRPADADYVVTGEGFEVVIEYGGQRAGVRLSKTDLDQGVLIGRAEKCVDEGLRSVLSRYISRVHVLLIREKGECHLYDIASLSGTFQDSRRVRSIPLVDSGTTVTLAARTGVTLHWRAL